MHANNSGLEGVHIGQAVLDCDERGRKTSVLGSVGQESSGEWVILMINRF